MILEGFYFRKGEAYRFEYLSVVSGEDEGVVQVIQDTCRV